MSEVLHLILRMMLEQWKTMDEELIVYRLKQTAEMAEELERERDELLAYLDAAHYANCNAELRRERDEAREKAERYRLEANALMLKVMEGAK